MWESCKGSMWENVKKCSRLCKETGTCDWISWVARSLQAARSCTHAKHARSWSVMPARALHDKKYRLTVQLPHGLDSQLATQSSRESKPLASSVLKSLTLHILFSPQNKYPLYSQNVESFQREYWEKNPREKQNWLIHNLHIETFQIPLLSSSPLLYPWEVHYQNIFSTYPHLWECHLVLGK